MFSNSIRVNHQAQQKMQQMLTRLREIPRSQSSESELNQLIKEIDEAIAYSNEEVVKSALRKIGLSSEEIVSLLRESRNHVSNLDVME